MHSRSSFTAVAIFVTVLSFSVMLSAGGRSVFQSAKAAQPAPSLSATALPLQPTPIPASPGTVIQVVGDVSNPRLLGLKDLQVMRRSSVTLSVDDQDGRKRVHTFTGVLLRDILTAAKPTVPGGTETSLRAFAVVQGLTGQSAIVAFPEFEAAFNAKQVLVAYLIDGSPLPIRGIAQLIVPEDATRGRFIDSVTRIEVGAPAP